MKNSCSLSGLVTLALLVLLIFARPAYGYIDPGTGSFVIQVLLGTALGCLLAVKMFWRQLKGFVKRLFGRKP
ncbi:MAG: hypothetical protein SVT52_02855 [Planctomycetota bacterium]|nr:hypothetical protein [Planctomycetota bacterium]